MRILNCFSNKELNLLNRINIIIHDREYTEEDLKELSRDIYKNGYMNMNLKYVEAEVYKDISERIKLFSKLDMDKINQHTQKEFEQDYYLSTVLMHGVVWNNPERINTGRRNNGKDLLTKEEYAKIEKINRENTEKFENYMKYLEDKYGKDLSAVSDYYELSKIN